MALEGSLGLCARAGKAVYGSHPVMRALQQGSAKLVIFDPNAGEATVRKFSLLATNADCPSLIAPVPIGPPVGQKNLAVMAITHTDFAKRLAEQIRNHVPRSTE